MENTVFTPAFEADITTPATYYTATDDEVVNGTKSVGDEKTAAVGALDTTDDDVTQAVKGQTITKIKANGKDYELIDAAARDLLGITTNSTTGVLSSSVMDKVDDELNKIGGEVRTVETALNATQTVLTSVQDQIEASISGAYVYRGTITEATMKSIEAQAKADITADKDTYYKVFAAGEYEYTAEDAAEDENVTEGDKNSTEIVKFANESSDGDYVLLENGNVFNVVSTVNEDSDAIYTGMNYAWNEEKQKFDALGSLVKTAVADNATRTVSAATVTTVTAMSDSDKSGGLKTSADGYDKTAGNDGLLTSEDKSDLDALKSSYNITATVVASETDGAADTLVFTATNLISGDQANL